MEKLSKEDRQLAILLMATKLDLPEVQAIAKVDKKLLAAVKTCIKQEWLYVKLGGLGLTAIGLTHLAKVFGEFIVTKLTWFGGNHWCFDHLYNAPRDRGPTAASVFVQRQLYEVHRAMDAAFNVQGEQQKGRYPWVKKTALRDLGEYHSEDCTWRYVWIQFKTPDFGVERRWKGKRK